MTRAPLAGEELLWSCKDEGESRRRGKWWGGVQDNGCRIQNSIEAFSKHPDLQSDCT